VPVIKGAGKELGLIIKDKEIERDDVTGVSICISLIYDRIFPTF